jgi:7-keto-8-aminopelargonate synthetase-like enzyme
MEHWLRVTKLTMTESHEKKFGFRYDFSNFYHGSGSDPLYILSPFKAWYDEAIANGYYLYSEPLETAPAPEVRVEDLKTGKKRDLLNFASYNYLGISYRDEVKRAAIDAINRYGLGASGSPILSGTFDVHRQLASRIAAFKKKEAAILFPTGYSANVGFLSALMRSGDHIVVDQYAHASIVDGAILAKSKLSFFRHNDVEDLHKKLARCTGKRLVVIEGVYSMDGDVCRLPEIVAVAKSHDARILICISLDLV